MTELSDTPRSFLLVANPTSGKGRSRRIAEEVARRLLSVGAVARVALTTRAGEALDIVRSARGANGPGVVVACGGDGTVQQVVQALVEDQERVRQIPLLGIVPAGRCNDFARALGLPRDPEAIVSTLLTGAVRRVDIGQVNGRAFCSVLTAGLDAEVSEFVERMWMPLRGTPAYLWGLLRVLGRYRACEVVLEGDFGTIAQPVFVASVANTHSYGGAIPIVPVADPFDGMLDLCVIDAIPLRRVLTLLPTILRGRHAGAPEVRFIRTRRLTLTSSRPMVLWADGERVAQTPAQVQLSARGVDLIVSAGAAQKGAQRAE